MNGEASEFFSPAREISGGAKRRGRRKSTLTAAEVLPRIQGAIEAAAGETIGELLAVRLRPLLAQTRSDDYPHVARLTLRAIGIRRDRFDHILATLKLLPLSSYRRRSRRPAQKRRAEPPARITCSACGNSATLLRAGMCVNRGRCERRAGTMIGNRSNG